MSRQVMCDRCGKKFVVEKSCFGTIESGDLSVGDISCPFCGTKYKIFTTDIKMREMRNAEMNDFGKLVGLLKSHGLSNGSSLGHHSSLYDEAAEAITILMQENIKIYAELAVYGQMAEDIQTKKFADFHVILEDREKVERERDAAVEDLRKTQIFGNSCAFCKNALDCDKRGRRKSVEECWEWRGPQKQEEVDHE